MDRRILAAAALTLAILSTSGCTPKDTCPPLCPSIALDDRYCASLAGGSCTVDGKRFVPGYSGDLLSKGQTLVIPVKGVLRDATDTSDLGIGFERGARPDGGVSEPPAIPMTATVLLDGVSGSARAYPLGNCPDSPFMGVCTYAIFRWFPPPADPARLTVTFSNGAPVHVSLQFTDVFCLDSREPRTCPAES